MNNFRTISQIIEPQNSIEGLKRSFYSIMISATILGGCRGNVPKNVQPVQSLSAISATSIAAPSSTFSAPVLAGTLLATDTPGPTETQTIIPSTFFPTATPLTPLEAGRIIDLNYLQMTDEKNGWAIESTGHIIHTEDSGYTWQDVTPSVEANQFYTYFLGFFALDDKTAWATAEKIVNCYPQTCNQTSIRTALIWHTNDAGKSWKASQPIPTNVDRNGATLSVHHYYPVMIQFIDHQTGWLLIDGGITTASGTGETVGAILLQTTNGGETWAIINDHYRNLYLPEAQNANLVAWTGFAFADSQTGWLGRNQFVHLDAIPVADIISAGGWKFLKTTDGGHSFSEAVITTPGDFFHPDFVGQSVDCNVVKMLPIAENTVGIQWSCMHKTFPYYFFSITTDNGLSWNTWHTTWNEFFLDAKEGWRQPCTYVGALCTLEYTSDGGRTWTMIKKVNWFVSQFDFVNTHTGWSLVIANDANGTKAFVHTTNDGKTWVEIKPKVAK